MFCDRHDIYLLCTRKSKGKKEYLPLRLVSANGKRGCAEMLFPTADECTFEALECALECRKDCDLRGIQEKEE